MKEVETRQAQAGETVTGKLAGESVRVIDGDGLNPRIVLEQDYVFALLRKIADEAGFSDRETCAVQALFESDGHFRYETPTLLIMVSNIKNSRTPAQSPLTEERKTGTGPLVPNQTEP